MEKYVILVDGADNETGTMEKMQAHRSPNLHRAFSVFIFNTDGEMLLQQRAFTKYHSGGLWTNACCSHPMPGESIVNAATRRLNEELGFSCPVEKIFEFIYQADFNNGLVEYEYDHVLTGVYDGPIIADPDEVETYLYKNPETIKRELQLHPEAYTAWFKIAFPRLELFLQDKQM